MELIFDYSRLKGKIIEKYDTQSKFIESISMSEPTFIKKINSNGYFTQKEIIEIMNKLDVEINDLNICNYFYCLKS